ncbi:MAG: SpoIIIAH-like family protein [Clostridia bacterium]|nr:SpoIIIAH-like family protein [Clostridia bacterium]
MLIKKRQVLTATLIIALCAAITVNWYFTKPEGTSAETTVAEEAVTGNLGDTLFVAGTTSKNENDKETDVDDSEPAKDEALSDENNVDAEKYFTSAKLKRTQSYDEIIDNIQKILENDSLDKAEKNKISVILSDYQNDIKVQTDAENLISAKTGKECLVVINGENCQVITEKNTLNDTLILQITEIIEKNTDILPEKLTIIELK